MRKRLRCAIYTRKSSEEGLEQEFNSLAAQREACAAYVRSQHAEGWRALADTYDDGGISGATLERPALQRLLDAVRAGRIDTVVVYKVDRLTRTLSDFARLVDIFDAHDISFVSITQQFNTTTSMGRLTLNVLLSFAQFEREVTSERIRDKIAASKKKGMWMGGFAPLGYRAKDRHLVVDAEEAEIVRALFEIYVEKGSIRSVIRAARKRGLRTRNGNEFSRGGLYLLLQNPIYVGRIRHRESTYPGLHEPIVERSLWERVQTQIASRRIRRHDRLDAKEPSLLAGKLFGRSGHRLTPTHANKQGRRYRYYVEAHNQTSADSGSRPLRLAAGEIESLVIDAIDRLLGAPARLMKSLDLGEISPEACLRLADRATRLRGKLSSPAKRQAFVRENVARIDIDDRTVYVRLVRRALLDALDCPSSAESGDLVDIAVPAELKRLGAELRYVIDGVKNQRSPQPDHSLVKSLLRARRWWRMWLESEGRSLRDIAKSEGVDDRYIRSILPLAFLAPDITEMILDGRQPVDLTAEQLIKRTKLPVDWGEQRRFLTSRLTCRGM